MRQFDYTKIPQELSTPEIMHLVSRIHEYKGKQEFYEAAKPSILAALSKTAKAQGAAASNRMDGIRSERAVLACRNALDEIHDCWGELRPDKQTMLRLHENLCGADSGKASRKASGKGVSVGKYRVAVYGVEALAGALEQAESSERTDPLVLISMFTLDFLCMRPFRDGNGRMGRLLLLLLLLRSGFLVGKYISLELLIEKNGQAFEEALLASARGWHSGENTYLPFATCLLGTILGACEDFSERLDPAWDGRRNKSGRIRDLFQNSPEVWSKRAISERFPDISIGMIELTLARLLAEGDIHKMGSGHSTAYLRNPDNNPTPEAARIPAKNLDAPGRLLI